MYEKIMIWTVYFDVVISDIINWELDKYACDSKV